MFAQALQDQGSLDQWPFLYQNERFLNMEHANDKFRDHCICLIKQMAKELGIEAVGSFLFEFKFEQQPKQEQEKKDQ